MTGGGSDPDFFALLGKVKDPKDGVAGPFPREGCGKLWRLLEGTRGVEPKLLLLLPQGFVSSSLIEVTAGLFLLLSLFFSPPLESLVVPFSIKSSASSKPDPFSVFLVA